MNCLICSILWAVFRSNMIEVKLSNARGVHTKGSSSKLEKKDKIETKYHCLSKNPSRRKKFLETRKKIKSKLSITA